MNILWFCMKNFYLNQLRYITELIQIWTFLCCISSSCFEWVKAVALQSCMCFHMCVFMQWLVFRCGNTPGLLNEIPAVEESRVQVACGVPASLSLSLLSSPSSPSSVHYSCNQLHYPCGLVSNAHSVLSLSLFAPSCGYILS